MRASGKVERMRRILVIGAIGWLCGAGCGVPEPIVTGAPAETEQTAPERAPNVADTSQPVSGTNRGDVIEGRYIPPALPDLTGTNEDVKERVVD